MSKARTMTRLIAALAVMLTGCGRRKGAVESEAERLRKSRDFISVYAVTNRFEVWKITPPFSRHLRTVETLEEAREVVDAYYVGWAEERIGPMPPGRKVE